MNQQSQTTLTAGLPSKPNQQSQTTLNGYALLHLCEKGSIQELNWFLDIPDIKNHCNMGVLTVNLETPFMCICSLGNPDLIIKTMDVFGEYCQPNYYIKNGYDNHYRFALRNLLPLNKKELATRLAFDNVIINMLDRFGIACCAPTEFDYILDNMICNQLENSAIKFIDLCKDNNVIDIKSMYIGQTVLNNACLHSASKVAIKLIDTYGIQCIPSNVPSTINHRYYYVGHKYKHSYVAIPNDTTLMLVCRNKLSDVAIKMIQQFGAFDCNLWHVNQYGNNALSYACNRFQYDIILAITAELKRIYSLLNDSARKHILYNILHMGLSSYLPLCCRWSITSELKSILRNREPTNIDTPENLFKQTQCINALNDLIRLYKGEPYEVINNNIKPLYGNATNSANEEPLEKEMEPLLISPELRQRHTKR